jgi:hypothetical protein
MLTMSTKSYSNKRLKLIYSRKPKTRKRRRRQRTRNKKMNLSLTSNYLNNKNLKTQKSYIRSNYKISMSSNRDR